MAIGHVFVYFARAAHAFSADIICWHCSIAIHSLPFVHIIPRCVGTLKACPDGRVPYCEEVASDLD